jgi:hypothetical protein
MSATKEKLYYHELRFGLGHAGVGTVILVTYLQAKRIIASQTSTKTIDPCDFIYKKYSCG